MTMDEQYIRTHDVIGRYLLDQLSARERRAFEVYYFEHPAMLKELELERALRGAAQSLGLIEAVASRESRAPRLLALLTTPAWSIAATVAAVGFGVLLFSFRGGTRESVTGPSPILADLDLARTRAGIPEKPVVQLSGEGVLALSIDAGGFDTKTLDASLRGPSVALSHLPLFPDEGYGVARLVIPAHNLRTGDYVLELSDASGQRLSYTFAIIR